MKQLGTKVLETERLRLRPFKASDAENMYKNWASDAEVTRYLTWPAHESVKGTRALLELWEKEADSPSTYQWCIELKETGEAIGSIGSAHLYEHIEAVEVGYCIGKAFWGKGIMSEALRAVRDFLFAEAEVNRVEACHDTNNPVSGKVMEKCGLRFEGIRKQGGKNNTGLCDLACYGLVKRDWEELLKL